MRIGIIGGGFMGEAFLRGILRAGVATPGDIAVAEVVPARRAALSEHGVRVTDDPESACIGAEIVILAVKPQDLPGGRGSSQWSYHPATMRLIAPRSGASIGLGDAVIEAGGRVRRRPGGGGPPCASRAWRAAMAGRSAPARRACRPPRPLRPPRPACAASPPPGWPPAWPGGWRSAPK